MALHQLAFPPQARAFWKGWSGRTIICIIIIHVVLHPSNITLVQFIFCRKLWSKFSIFHISSGVAIELCYMSAALPNYILTGNTCQKVKYLTHHLSNFTFFRRCNENTLRPCNSLQSKTHYSHNSNLGVLRLKITWKLSNRSYYNSNILQHAASQTPNGEVQWGFENYIWNKQTPLKYSC